MFYYRLYSKLQCRAGKAVLKQGNQYIFQQCAGEQAASQNKNSKHSRGKKGTEPHWLILILIRQKAANLKYRMGLPKLAQTDHEPAGIFHKKTEEKEW